MKKIIIIFYVILSHSAFSSNLLGGEITCRNINGLMYETTLTIYRDTMSGNLPLNYTITYKDSIDTIIASHVVSTSNGLLQWNGFKSYKYIDTISFPNVGTYKVASWDCCRDSVDNIANSTSAGMYIDCRILADGLNSSPKFLSVPITLAQLNQPFTNNITPYDVDDDSLSWELAIPEDFVSNGLGGFNIVTLPYNYPPSDTSLQFQIDSVLGDISFKPNLAGKYQIAVKLIEWRNGVQIGYVKREMQLIVLPVVNNPLVVQASFQVLASISGSWTTVFLQNWIPVNPRPDIYIYPGEKLFIDLTMSDPDLWGFPDSYGYSASMENSTAYINCNGVNDWADCYYQWPTVSTADVSGQPYFVTFRTYEQFSSGQYFGNLYKDYTFRIFVSNTTTDINEISNETKSVYLKSIDMLGRETDPNLPGFRIDLYSDGKTKKVFRGE